jgi:hypothetical protein
MPANSIGLKEGPYKDFFNNTGATINEFIRVALDSSGYIAPAAIGQRGIGFTAAKILDQAYGPVRLINAQGTQIGISVGAIAITDTVYSAALGKVDIVAAAANRLGIPLNATTGANQPVEFIVMNGGGIGDLLLTFTGHNGAGACTATGTLVGDRVISIAGLTTVGGLAASFESTITVADQIQQTSATDLSAKNFTMLIQRGTA